MANFYPRGLVNVAATSTFFFVLTYSSLENLGGDVLRRNRFPFPQCGTLESKQRLALEAQDQTMSTCQHQHVVTHVSMRRAQRRRRHEATDGGFIFSSFGRECTRPYNAILRIIRDMFTFKKTFETFEEKIKNCARVRMYRTQTRLGGEGGGHFST